MIVGTDSWGALKREMAGLLVLLKKIPTSAPVVWFPWGMKVNLSS